MDDEENTNGYVRQWAEEPPSGIFASRVELEPIHAAVVFMDPDDATAFRCDPDCDLPRDLWDTGRNRVRKYQMLREFISQACGPIVRLPFPRNEEEDDNNK
jgi:hypothetical protein